MMRMIKEPLKDYRGVIYRRREEILKNPTTIFTHLKHLNRFYELQQLQQLEDFAHRNGMVVVPASIFNWRRREKMVNQKYVCNGNSYYLVKLNELKVQELYNFQKLIENENEYI